jgi:hypothetical protein
MKAESGRLMAEGIRHQGSAQRQDKWVMGEREPRGRGCRHKVNEGAINRQLLAKEKANGFLKS